MELKKSNFATYEEKDFFVEAKKASNLYYNRFETYPKELLDITKNPLEQTVFFIDGVLVYENLSSLPFEVYINELIAATDDIPEVMHKLEQKMNTLQTARALENANSGFMIKIPKNYKFEQLNIFTFNKKTSYTKNVIYLEEKANLKVVHYNFTEELDYVSNIVDIKLENDANLEYLYVNDYCENTRAYNAVRATEGANSNFNFTNLSLEYLTNFNDLFVTLAGDNSNVEINNLTFASTNMKNNTNVEIVHNAKNTSSDVNTKALATANANVTFNTISTINKDMAGSDARQKTIGLILSDEAYLSANPLLLIDCNDVSASHGASIGRFSDEDLFYLMSRGLSKQDAQKLIISGLINPFVNLVEEDYLKNICKNNYAKCLEV